MGKKRSRPSSGPKTHVPSDFKRRKAKVGKRAAKAANVTDTSFRSVSVRVGDQNVDFFASTRSASLESLEELSSSRGRSLPLLLGSLTHHAPNVRSSSLRGFRDLLSRADPASVRCVLPSLLPAAGRCLVDDDSECRSLALDLVRECVRAGGTDASVPFLPLLLAYASSAVNSLDDGTRRDGAAAVEAMCASFGTAMREAASTTAAVYFGSTSAAAGGGGGGSALLLAYVRLLSDEARDVARAQARAEFEEGRSKKKNRRKGGGAAEGRGVGGGPVLRSLVALLRATSSCGDADGPFVGGDDVDTAVPRSGSSSLLAQPDVEFRTGRTSCNALLALRGSSASSSAFSSYYRGWRVSSGGTHRSSGAKAPTRVLVDLLDGLRDRIVETSQHGRRLGGEILGRGGGGEEAGGLAISFAHFDALSLLISAARLLWTDRCAPRLHRLGSSSSSKDIRDLRSSGTALLRLLLEVFPLMDDSGDEFHNGRRFDALNASVCAGLVEFGSSLQDVEGGQVGGRGSKDVCRGGGVDGDAWVRAVFDHVLPRLDPTSSSLSSSYGEENGVGGKKESEKRGDEPTEDEEAALSLSSSSSLSSSVLIGAVGRLLLRSAGDGRYLLREGSRREELLHAFGGAFFLSPEASSGFGAGVAKANKTLGDGVRASPAGRGAALLLAALLVQHCPRGLVPSHCCRFRNEEENERDVETDGDDTYDSSSAWSSVCAMAVSLPLFLQSWEADYPDETAAILAVLLRIVRTHGAGRVVEVDGMVMEVFDDDDGNEEVQKKDGSGAEGGDDERTLDAARGELVRSLRSSLVPLFATPKKSKNKCMERKKRRGDEDKSAQKDNGAAASATPKRESIFERLPHQAQRLAIALVGMLRFPPPAMIDVLGVICARAGAAAEDGTTRIGDDMATYVMEVIHDIRQTMSLQAYLMFVVRCAGVTTTRSETIARKKHSVVSHISERQIFSWDELFAQDAAVARACRALIRCGQPSSKLMLSLSPVLSLWLSSGAPSTGASAAVIGGAMGTRTALAVISSLNLTSFSFPTPLSFSGEEATQVSDKRSLFLADAAPRLEQLVIEAVCDYFELLRVVSLSPMSAGGAGNEAAIKMARQARLLAPVVALFSCQPRLLERTVEQASSRAVSISTCHSSRGGSAQRVKPNADTSGEDSDGGALGSIIQSLLYLLRCKSLFNVLMVERVARTLRRTAVEIEATVAGGPLDRLGSELRTEVRMMVGDETES